MNLWLFRFPEHTTYQSARVAARTQEDATGYCRDAIAGARYVFVNWFGKMPDPCRPGLKMVTFADGTVKEADEEGNLR